VYLARYPDIIITLRGDEQRADGVLGKVDEAVRIGVVYGKVNVVVSSTAIG